MTSLCRMTLALLPVVACTAPVGIDGVADEISTIRHGTIVGNPGELDDSSSLEFSLAASEGMLFHAATGLGQGVVLWSCGEDPEPRAVALDHTVDLISRPSVTVPAGSWCGLDLQLQPPLRVRGQGLAGGSFVLELAVEQVRVESEAGFELLVDGTYVLQLGALDWIGSMELDEGTDLPLIVGVDDARHEPLVGQLEEASALFLAPGGVLDRETPLAVGRRWRSPPMQVPVEVFDTGEPEEQTPPGAPGPGGTTRTSGHIGSGGPSGPSGP